MWWWKTWQNPELLRRLAKVLRLSKVYHFQLTCTRKLVVAGIVYVASIVTFDPDPLEVIPVVVAGALREVFAASKMPFIKRVVYTSSSKAILLPGFNVELNVSTETRNIEALEVAWKPPPYEQTRVWPVYAASKTEAERMMWAFMEVE